MYEFRVQFLIIVYVFASMGYNKIGIVWDRLMLSLGWPAGRIVAWRLDASRLEA